MSGQSTTQAQSNGADLLKGQMNPEDDRPFDLIKFILLALIGGSIFLLPYMRTIYYEYILDFLQITPIQFGTILVCYGTTSTIGTFFSGILADRYSAKWLLVISLLATGLGGVILLNKPGYYGFLALYILWGVSITFTYNSAHFKAIRYTGNAKQQGRLYGSIGGLRRTLSGLVAFSGSLIFAYIVGADQAKGLDGFKGVIIFYTSIYFVIALAVIIFWKRDTPPADEDKWKIKDSIAVFKHPATWYLGFIIYFVYAMARCLDLVAPFMRTVLEIDPSVNVMLNTLRGIIFPFIGGVWVGFILDRSARKIFVCQVTTAVGCLAFLAMAFLPSVGMTWHVVFYALLGVAIGAQSGAFLPIFSLLEISNIPKKITGSIIGVSISIGYLPDITLNFLTNYVAQTYGYDEGTRILFIVAVIHGAIAITLFSLFRRYLARYKSNNLA